ncbi:transposase zinc-binding domain-containing protein [Mameliella sp.]|uniref:transposase zinc-binding domain-containing protein n=1 Tax=Mameliella sp. TaxID=1924940 RepID=UPI003D1357B2
MSREGAIEACRTEALGGHVAGCAKCGHHHIAYNSCKNRHCPKCQGPAARDWMAARAEDLLPVEFFHVVFTLPAGIAQIAFWSEPSCRHGFETDGEQGHLWHAVPGVRRNGHDHRSRPQMARRPDRHDLRAAHLGIGVVLKARLRRDPTTHTST